MNLENQPHVLGMNVQKKKNRLKSQVLAYVLRYYLSYVLPKTLKSKDNICHSQIIALLTHSLDYMNMVGTEK